MTEAELVEKLAIWHCSISVGSADKWDGSLDEDHKEYHRQQVRKEILPHIQYYTNSLLAAAVEACARKLNTARCKWALRATDAASGKITGSVRAELQACIDDTKEMFATVTPAEAHALAELREKIAAGNARHAMNQKLGEYLDEDANAKSTF